MVDEFGNSETPDHTIEEIDDFIKFNDVGGTFLTEETLTPIKPKDETIYDLNNICPILLFEELVNHRDH